jgi:hypothetical protein
VQALTVPIDCSPGYYCPEGQRFPCPVGTYSDKSNLVQASDCSTCPAGQYCIGGQDAPTGDCQAGYYCAPGSSSPTPSGVISNPYISIVPSGACPVGHYCPAGTRLPIKCPAGTFNSQPGKANCVSCPEGFYQKLAGQTSCTQSCEDGFHCIIGSYLDRPYEGPAGIGEVCQLGHYCQNGLMNPCQPGFYQNVYGQLNCAKCPQGYYCPGSGTV